MYFLQQIATEVVFFLVLPYAFWRCGARCQLACAFQQMQTLFKSLDISRLMTT